MTAKAPQPPKKVDSRFDDWLFRFWRYVNGLPEESSSTTTVTPGNIDHASLANLNSGNTRHISQSQYDELTGGGPTSLHTHSVGGITHASLPDLKGSGPDYYHLSLVQLNDLTDSGATTLHKHNHALQDNLNSFSYYHLTQNERSDIIGAQYLTLANASTLTNERAIALGQGLTHTDGGAGSSYTINLQSFVGDNGSGGLIGAVPAPAAGDGAVRKYLSADGIWRDPVTDIVHNGTSGIQGGSGGSAFNPNTFNNTAFNVTNSPQYYHLSEDDYNNINRQDAVTTVSVNTTMTDSYSVYIVDTSAKTMTLPLITAARVGKSWTVVMDCNGYVDVAPTNPNAIILPGGTDTIRLDQIGSTLTMRAITTTQWVIV